MPAAFENPLDIVRRLTEVGAALSAEKDNNRLMELILESAREFTNADGGTLYSRTEDDHLRFEIMLTHSLGIRLGGTSGADIELPPVPLYRADGGAHDETVAARAATAVETVNIADAYTNEDFDFSGTRAFDARTGYRSQSFLAVPMCNHDDEVIGVLQLINAVMPGTEQVVAFTEQDQQLVESLASQAAIALSNKRLIDGQRVLFEAFIELMAAAIDDKSPYTGGHCRRVPELTMLLAQAASDTKEGPLADFTMDDDDRYELKIAGWLHDCGKVTTPEYVVDKATKLETIYDRVHEVETRFELLKRDAEIAQLREQMALHGCPEAPDHNAQLHEKCAELDDECEFLRRANVGGEFMSEDDQERVREIGARTLRDARGDVRPLLTDNEVYNLTIEKGTLTKEEREVINHHIVATIKMLESLPYPPYLMRVPEYAGGHHERMDGKGYPRGLTREQMSVQARVMGIADIFEALTAADRPYKKGMPLSQALSILGRMKEDQHIDGDLFDVFIREKVYLRYGELFLDSDQLDAVDLESIPGYKNHQVA
ncbi:MAG: HD-GYP domain-containing protein (c-di-GMP phosphodiesterase class II) [Gammaproteobacteria bacterium]